MNTNIFVCKEDCSVKYDTNCNEYFFEKGQEYEYNYNIHRKFVTPIYLNGIYNGSINTKFIDRYFISKSESEMISEVDKWFGELLESPMKLKRIKKNEN
jgi:hypothetical protein